MNRLRPDRADQRFIRRLLIVAVLLAVGVALVRSIDLMILLFGAVLGAVAIHAAADLYCRHLRVPRHWALPAAMVSALGAAGFLVWLFGVQFGGQINALVIQLPDLLHQLATWASRSPVGTKVVDAVQAAFAGSRIAKDIGGLVQGSAELLLNALLLLIGALFLAASPDVYVRGFLLLVPRHSRPAVADALSDAAVTLRLWLRAQLILMTTMGVGVGLGLWAAGVPSAAALGLLAGISEFIPYVGPTAAMLPALGLAATVGTPQVLGTLATYAGVRLVQTNFLTPFVQNRVIAIPPAMTLFAIIAIGNVFGVFGLFFSAAILVVGFSLVRSLYLREVLGEDIPPPRDPHAPTVDSPPSETPRLVD